MSRLSALGHLLTGRQLPRTPPSKSCVRTLDFNETLDDDRDPDRRETFSTPPIRLDTSSAPESMTKGMKDYHMTSEDLQFMQRLKEEKELKRLKDEAKALEAEVRSQTMALELTLAAQERTQNELKQFPSCEEIRKWALEFLEMSSPSSTDLAHLDVRALLALVPENDLIKAIDDQFDVIQQLEDMVEKRKEERAKKREQQGSLLAAEKSKILELMATLAELKSSLAQQLEANEALEKQQPPDLDAKPAQSGRRAKDKMPSAKTETPDDPTNQSKTRRGNPRRHAEKAEQAKSPERAKRATPKSDTAPQGKDSQSKNSRKPKEPPATSEVSTAPRKGPRARPTAATSVAPVAVTRGRNKTAAAATAPAATAPPTNDQVLRRSKRIASKK